MEKKSYFAAIIVLSQVLSLFSLICDIIGIKTGLLLQDLSVSIVFWSCFQDITNVTHLQSPLHVRVNHQVKIKLLLIIFLSFLFIGLFENKSEISHF